jgi:hypothetical protein
MPASNVLAQDLAPSMAQNLATSSGATISHSAQARPRKPHRQCTGTSTGARIGAVTFSIRAGAAPSETSAVCSTGTMVPGDNEALYGSRPAALFNNDSNLGQQCTHPGASGAPIRSCLSISICYYQHAQCVLSHAQIPGLQVAAGVVAEVAVCTSQLQRQVSPCKLPGWTITVAQTHISNGQSSPAHLAGCHRCCKMALVCPAIAGKLLEASSHVRYRDDAFDLGQWQSLSHACGHPVFAAFQPAAKTCAAELFIRHDTELGRWASATGSALWNAESFATTRASSAASTIWRSVTSRARGIALWLVLEQLHSAKLQNGNSRRQEKAASGHAEAPCAAVELLDMGMYAWAPDLTPCSLPGGKSVVAGTVGGYLHLVQAQSQRLAPRMLLFDWPLSACTGGAPLLLQLAPGFFDAPGGQSVIIFSSSKCCWYCCFCFCSSGGGGTISIVWHSLAACAPTHTW